MIRTWATRWLSIVCLVGLFAGDGAALVDADLYHRGAVGQTADRAHVESAGNPACHAEHCALGVVAAQPNFAGPLLFSTSLITLPTRESGDVPPIDPPGSGLTTNQLSRAPPIS